MQILLSLSVFCGPSSVDNSETDLSIALTLWVNHPNAVNGRKNSHAQNVGH